MMMMMMKKVKGKVHPTIGQEAQEEE